jgi:Cu(I)/Ag(I) efflux system protein CusF
MRLYKAVILVNVALAFGFLAGSLWRADEVDRLRRELSAAQQARKAQEAAQTTGTALGIVRGVFPQKDLLYLTHEDIPGLMPSMTMGFRTKDPELARGLVPGDQVKFTVQKTGKDYVVIALRKEGSR